MVKYDIHCHRMLHQSTSISDLNKRVHCSLNKVQNSDETVKWGRAFQIWIRILSLQNFFSLNITKSPKVFEKGQREDREGLTCTDMQMASKTKNRAAQIAAHTLWGSVTSLSIHAFNPLYLYTANSRLPFCRNIFSVSLLFECTKYILNFELTMSEFLLAHLSPRVQIILDYSQAVSGLLVDAG